jgi:hypothetical protein
MSLSRTKRLFSILAVFAIATPIAALSSAAKSKTTAHATMDLVANANLAGTVVKAGTYDVEANESTLTLKRDGKVVAQAPISWKDESSKSQSSSMVADNGVVREVHFRGKNRYAQIASGSTSSAAGQD